LADIAINTNRLGKTYGRGEPALIDLDLAIAAGEIFGFLGHNGAGKTTTVSILTTLLEPTSGSASVMGHDVKTDSGAVRKLIGYLPENVQFYDNLTLAENLAFFAKLSGLSKPNGRINEVLSFLDFTGHENKKMSSFSKGMRQRAGIAQAILHAPEVLFLDEPTSGLDPQGVKTLRETIIRLNKELGMTVFMNTHLLSEVTKTCTSIGILQEGRLIYHDSLANTEKRFAGMESLEDAYFAIEAQNK
jgi:ABC-2 type transport system ATP-binding protein